MTSASSPACSECTAVAKAAAALHEHDRTTRGGGYTVRSVAADGFFDLGRPVLRVVFDRQRRITVDASGHEVQARAAATFVSCQIVLARDESRWRVVDTQAPERLA